MNGTTYKRCGCRDAAGKRLGQGCPKLHRGNGWNPNHGVWQYQIDLPPAADGRRRPLCRGHQPRGGGYGPGDARSDGPAYR